MKTFASESVTEMYLSRFASRHRTKFYWSYERNWIGNNLSFNDLMINDWIYDIYEILDGTSLDQSKAIKIF